MELLALEDLPFDEDGQLPDDDEALYHVTELDSAGDPSANPTRISSSQIHMPWLAGHPANFPSS